MWLELVLLWCLAARVGCFSPLGESLFFPCDEMVDKHPSRIWHQELVFEHVDAFLSAPNAMLMHELAACGCHPCPLHHTMAVHTPAY